MRRSPLSSAVTAALVLLALPLVVAGVETMLAGGVPWWAAGVAFALVQAARLVPIRPRAARDVDLADIPVIGTAVLLGPVVAPISLVTRVVAGLAHGLPPARIARQAVRTAVVSGAAAQAFLVVCRVLPEAHGLTILASASAAVVYVAVDLAIRLLYRAVGSTAERVWPAISRVVVATLQWTLATAMTIEVLRIEPLFLIIAIPLFAAGAIQTRARFQDERDARVLRTLVEVGRAVGSSLDPVEVFRAVYATVRRSLEADSFFVALARPGTTQLAYRFVVEGGEEQEQRERERQGSLAGLCMDEDRPILLRDSRRDRARLGLRSSGWRRTHERSAMVAPLRIRGWVVGAIAAHSVRPKAYDDGDLELLEVIAAESAIAIERADLYDRSATLSRRLLDLQRIGVELAAERELPSLTARLADAVKETLGAATAAVYLEGEVPDVAAALPLIERTTSSRQPTAVPDTAALAEELRPLIEERGHRALLVQPLVAANELVGVLFVAWPEPHELSDDERELVRLLAGFGATAIRSARLYGELEDAYLSTVQTLMTTIQARDGYREDHAARVAADAAGLGERLGLPDTSLRNLRYAALFHAIGKISVPQSVLAKATPLTPDERRIVREHPILGARILESIRFLHGVVPIVRHANERWDGTGYPDGLAYEAIPYEARILQIALSYHTMLADRPYRRGLEPAVALAELRLLSGIRYDPGLVDRFITMIEERGTPVAERVVADGARELAVLAEITPQFNSLLDLKALLDGVLSSLERHWTGARVLILLRDEHTEELVVRAAGGEPGTTTPGFRLARGHGLAGQVLQRREAIVVDDAQAEARDAGDKDTRAVVMAPLINEGRAIGVLSVSSDRPHAFSRRDLLLLEAVAAQIAAAIEVAELHERLKRTANTDALTGLHNYRYFYDRLEEEVARAERRAAPLAVAYFDIDGLKVVNDTFGHIAGDTVLRALGGIINARVRTEDVPARYGGDEFAIVMPETRREEAEQVVQRLMQALDETRIELSDGVRIGMPARSWGVAAYPEDGASATDLVANADARAYGRKRAKA